MLKSELIKLRKLYQEQVDKNNTINQLLHTKEVASFIKLTNIDVNQFTNLDISNIIKNILTNFSFKQTNGILVCTSAYYIDDDICYEETSKRVVNTSINSPYAQIKNYFDIESGKGIRAYRPIEGVNNYGDRDYYSPYVADIEKDYIVLNPYDTSLNQNGYKEVREFFFTNAMEFGQAKAKKKLLEKYPRI